MNVRHHNQRMRGGVTLIELLVVVTILMMLAAFAIPAIRPMTEGRRIREAARAIDVFLTQAKTHAITTQRTSGVVFERFEQTDTAGNPFYQDDACNILRIVEIPPPYAGDLFDSRVRIQNWTTLAWSGGGREGHPHYNPTSPSPNPQPINRIVLKLAIQVSSMADRLLRWGDQVQFGFQGPFYTIENDPWDDGTGSVGADFDVDPDGYIVFSNGTDTNGDGFIDNKILTVVADADEIGGVTWPNAPNTRSDPPDPAFLMPSPPTGAIFWSPDTTFQFYRQPQPTALAPLRLPESTIIDLGDSGYAPDPVGVPDWFGYVQTPLTTPHQRGEHRSPMLLFAPSGSVVSAYHWNAAGSAYGPSRVTDPIFLMVGKWERTGGDPAGDSLAEDGLHNWQDASNLWIGIGLQSGFVTAADVDTRYLHDNGTPADPSDDYLADNTNTAGVSVPQTVYDSRRFAREAQISKGALSE